MGKQKKNCKVFTPSDVVKKMLDIAGYCENLYGRKILENSCGDGHFLVEIVSRYIGDCRRNGYNDIKICEGLERDVVGFEIDEDTYQTCLTHLDDLLEKNSLPNVKWNIRQADALKTNMETDFLFVVGNPPYITYSALPNEDREFIKNAFEVCKDGKPDYYYAFIESAIKHMSNNGRLVYLVPSNFFKTRFAHKLRSAMLPLLTDIYDYTEQKIFDSALTASAIIVCDKSIKAKKVKYHDVASGRTFQEDKELLMERWIFCSLISTEEVTETKIRFGDIYPASSSIATLYNDAFVIRSDDATKIVESEVLRVAVSPKSMSNKKSEYIIFPYYYDNEGNFQRYPEEIFEISFPCAVKHLETYKEKLGARDSDRTTKWYEYGRSQAIAHLNQSKLLLSTLVTNKVKVYELDENTIPYSGIYIIASPGNKLSDAKRILESDDFLNYAKKVGIHANGTSIRISIRDVNEYQFCE